MFKFLLIDMDDTVLDFKKAEYVAIRKTLQEAGLNPTDGVCARYSEINDSYWKRLEQKLITRDRLRVERFADLFDALGYDGDPRAMALEYESTLARQSYLVDGALPLVQALHGRCRLFIITNGTASVQRERFGRSPLVPYFEDCFISEEMGCAKPEKIFFDRVAASVPNFSPRDTLVVGDSLSSDIRGGINAGLDTCWYNPTGKEAPADMAITYTVRRLDEIFSIFVT